MVAVSFYSVGSLNAFWNNLIVVLNICSYCGWEIGEVPLFCTRGRLSHCWALESSGWIAWLKSAFDSIFFLLNLTSTVCFSNIMWNNSRIWFPVVFCYWKPIHFSVMEIFSLYLTLICQLHELKCLYKGKIPPNQKLFFQIPWWLMVLKICIWPLVHIFWPCCLLLHSWKPDIFSHSSIWSKREENKRNKIKEKIKAYSRKNVFKCLGKLFEHQ